MNWKTLYLKTTERLRRQGKYGAIAVWYRGSVIAFGDEVGLCEFKNVRLNELGLRICGKEIAERMMHLNSKGIACSLHTAFSGEFQIRFVRKKKRYVRRFTAHDERALKPKEISNGKLHAKSKEEAYVRRKKDQVGKVNQIRKDGKSGKVEKEKQSSSRVGRIKADRNKSSRQVRFNW